MKRIVLRIDAQGQGRCLYTEAIPLASLGRLHLSRASMIEFNHQAQQWEVADPQGKVLKQSPSRQACLDWEAAHFNH